MNRITKHKWYPVILAAVICLIAAGWILITAHGRADGDAKATELQIRYLTNDRLNELRNALGLRTLSIQAQLGRAATAHAAYMSRQRRAEGHEKRENAGFTGLEAMDRAAYAGYQGEMVLEVDAGRVADYDQMLTQMLHDPYSRYILLHPGVDSIGYGIDKEYGVMLLGDSSGTDWAPISISYPYPGQQEVGNCYLSRLREVPEEVRVRNLRGQIGEPITFTVYYPNAARVQLRELHFSLTDTRRGETVECYLSLPQDSYQLVQSLVAYPQALYLSDTRYEASLQCEIWCEGRLLEMLDRTWSYTSSGPDSIGEVSRLEVLRTLQQIFRLEELPFEATSPDEGTRREQMAIWMINLIRTYCRELYHEVVLDYRETFSDINKCSNEGRAAVQRAYQLGLVTDQGGGMFSPDVYITKTEFESWIQVLEARIEPYLPVPAEESMEESEAESPGETEGESPEPSSGSASGNESRQ
ncbi:MAG: S-layer homology domain-containing protein [Firmicutes bacterium]|nr:S-layer homology domain-containing protein [Bacillota bacterium]